MSSGVAVGLLTENSMGYNHKIGVFLRHNILLTFAFVLVAWWV